MDIEQQKTQEYDHGDFRDILRKIDLFIKNKGGIKAESKNGEGEDRPSSYRLQKAKTLKPGARPRSKKTLSGRETDGKDDHES